MLTLGMQTLMASTSNFKNVSERQNNREICGEKGNNT